jgi:hypothetical protein
MDAEIPIPPGLDPLTIQPVASRYSDYAIQAYQIASVLEVFYFITLRLLISELFLNILFSGYFLGQVAGLLDHHVMRV